MDYAQGVSQPVGYGMGSQVALSNLAPNQNSVFGEIDKLQKEIDVLGKLAQSVEDKIASVLIPSRPENMDSEKEMSAVSGLQEDIAIKRRQISNINRKLSDLISRVAL